MRPKFLRKNRQHSLPQCIKHLHAACGLNLALRCCWELQGKRTCRLGSGVKNGRKICPGERKQTSRRPTQETTKTTQGRRLVAVLHLVYSGHLLHPLGSMPPVILVAFSIYCAQRFRKSAVVQPHCDTHKASFTPVIRNLFTLNTITPYFCSAPAATRHHKQDLSGIQFHVRSEKSKVPGPKGSIIDALQTSLPC